MSEEAPVTIDERTAAALERTALALEGILAELRGAEAERAAQLQRYVAGHDLRPTVEKVAAAVDRDDMPPAEKVDRVRDITAEALGQRDTVSEHGSSP